MRLDKSGYLALVRTFGPFLQRPARMQERALRVLGALVDEFGGTVVLDPRTTVVLGRCSS